MWLCCCCWEVSSPSKLETKVTLWQLSTHTQMTFWTSQIMTREVMEKDVGHEHPYMCSLVFRCFFAHDWDHLSSNYLHIMLCPVFQNHCDQLERKMGNLCMSLCMCVQEATWRPLCLLCTLPENPSPLESLSSTSPGRQHTHRGGNGRSPLVQPREKVSEREIRHWFMTSLTFHNHKTKYTSITAMLNSSKRGLRI